MRATILIVGDYPGLSTTRAELLREWQTVTTGTSGASEVLRARACDLLLFCQTVPETTVRELAAQAIELNPRLKVLTISEVGQIRQLGSSALVAELNNPSCLRRAVAALLQSNEQQTGRSL
jgi:DNA-binding NtrC family response regulator